MSFVPWVVAQGNRCQSALQSIDQCSRARIEPKPGSEHDEQSPFRFVCPNVKSVVRISADDCLEDARYQSQQKRSVHLQKCQNLVESCNQCWIKVTANSILELPRSKTISEERRKSVSVSELSQTCFLQRLPAKQFANKNDSNEFWRSSSEKSFCQNENR